MLLERSAGTYLPYLGHYPNTNTVLLEDGSLLAMGRLRGVPFELASQGDRNAAARVLNSLFRQIADDRVTLGIHLVRFWKTDELPTPRFHNGFAQRFEAAYRACVLDKVFENVWFLSLLAAPLSSGTQKQGRREITRMFTRFRKIREPHDPYRFQMIEDLWTTLTRSLEGYDLRRLGIREHKGLLYSEIGEALRMMLTCQYLPVGLTDGPLGSAIYTDRAIFERRHYRLLHPRSVRFGALFGLREYMAVTRPGMFDELLPLNMELVLSQSFGYLARQTSIQRLARKQNQMIGSSDRAYAQVADLDNALSEVAGGEVVRGMHHCSLAVYADTYPELEAAAGDAQNAMANSSAVIVQESLGNEAAYFAQLPGNLDWRTRPGVISTRNLAHFADFGSFPEGSREGHWGPAVMRFRTVGHTAYDYIPHAGDAGDVGMTLVCGLTGSGKTTWLMAMLAMLDQCIGEDGVIFFFDRDRGGELLVRAVEGIYVEVRAGEPSGLAPLRGLQDTPADREFLVRWVKALIRLDGHGPLPPQDDERIARGINAIMRNPVELRSLDGLRQFLGWRDPRGAGPRLERWCAGKALGWAFDGEVDEISFGPQHLGARMFGFDLTAIFDNDEVIASAAQYLLHRIGSVIDGRRAVIALDECQAYMPHPGFRDGTDDFIRRGRKNNAVVFLCTQHPEDLMEGTFGTVVIEDVLTKIFFRNAQASEATYRERLKLTEGEFRAISEQILPGSYQCLIKRPGGSVIVDFNLSRMRKFVAVLSGRANTVRYAEKLRNQTPQWLDPFMETYETAARD